MEQTEGELESRLSEDTDYSKKGFGLSIDPIKSDYQKNLEEKGWELITKFKAVTGEVDYTKNRRLIRFLIEDCRNLFPGKKVKLARAYDELAKRIPSEKKVIAIYVKDRE